MLPGAGADRHNQMLLAKEEASLVGPSKWRNSCLCTPGVKTRAVHWTLNLSAAQPLPLPQDSRNRQLCCSAALQSREGAPLLCVMPPPWLPREAKVSRVFSYGSGYFS